MNTPSNREVALFSAALELDASQRGAYLDDACADDPALRQHLEALLRVHEEAIPFLETPPRAAQESSPGAEASTMTVRLSISPSEKVGDRIGRYKLLQQIGEGGCGVVYMAEQEEPVRRRVTLKVIKLGMDTKQVIARFEAERQALALMDHPNIAKVFDAGASETGRPYFVMELVRGIKITDYCDQSNLSTRERLDLFIQVCQAVQHAHQKGVIHRDLKPSNILVTSRDGVPVPKVIDFGIAKATTDQRLTDKTLFTAFEQFLGTPAYMSPEQAEMSELGIDTRSDIYSLGVLLYELLTGQTPFDATELLRTGLEAMRRTIREEEPPRPSTRLSTMIAGDLSIVAKHRQVEPRKLASLMRGDVDWIVMKALEKDRARRYETANGLAMDVQRYLADEPVIARPPSRLYKFQKTVQRHKFGFAASGAVAATLMIGLAVSTWLLIKEREDRRSAVAANAKSQQVADFLKKMLQGVGPSVAMGRDTAMLREILDETAKSVDKDLTNQPEVEAELRDTIGRVYYRLAEYDQAEAMDRAALAIRRKLFGNEHTAVADSLEAWATCFGIGGDQRSLIEAEALHREALRIRRKLLRNDDPAIAASLTGIADVFIRSGRAVEAEPMYREALAIRRRGFGDEHVLTALSIHNLADGLQAQGKLSEAETSYREALAMGRRLRGNDSPFTSGSLNNLGDVLRSEGKLTEAEGAYREALAACRKVLGNEHPGTVGPLINLAELLSRQGRMVEAEPLLLSACDSLKQRGAFGNEPLLKQALQRMVQFYESSNRPDQAAEWKKRLAGSDKAEK